MNLSMKWLSDYVQVDVSPRQFSEAMTMSGSKVEGYEIEGSEISNVVVGKILNIEKHPDADSLVVCQVDVGEEAPLQIVTGATNVFEGALVPVAKHKSKLPGGKEIKKGKLRGVESNGMLCSLGELGLTANDFPYAIEDGIFILEEDCRIGQDIQSAIGLDDTCVEFEITSNRPDCLSVLGLAREAAITFDKPFQMPSPTVGKGIGNIHDDLKVTVENPQLCLRYTARMVKNVRIAPSPRWMRERLRASGVRPINNIVDITNYVMLEYGHPMHAFDYKYVKGGQIVVRNAREGETIMTLDGVERSLTPDMLVIADAEKPSAVAGVMGGEYSGIMEDTDTVIFEGACFFGPSVRITAKKLGMRTESSSRFEKGLDPNTCMSAIQRACQLVEELDAGDVVEGIIDVNNSTISPRRIPFDAGWINRFLGTDIPEEQMRAILTRLECRFEPGVVIPPSFRADLEDKADIAEEVARFYGYNNIPSTVLRGTAEATVTPRQQFERTISDTMLAQGLSEVVTYSFISPKYYDKIRLPKESPLRRSVTILNPLGEDTSIMRTTTLPSMMEVLTRNYNNRNPQAGLFEIATEYHPVEGQELPDETANLTIGMYGGDCDFFTLKGMVENLLHVLNIPDWEVTAETGDPTFHPGRCAVITCGGETLGILGEVHPKVCENYGIGCRCLLARLPVAALFDHVGAPRQYRALPRFPASTRDLALVCDDSLPALSIEKAIRKAVGGILESLELFDLYKGAQVPEGKKSLAYTLVMRAPDRTLTDEEADKAIAKALRILEGMGVTLRA